MLSLERKRLYINALLIGGLSLIIFAFVVDRWLQSEPPLQKSAEILGRWITEQSREVDEFVRDPRLKAAMDSVPELFDFLENVSFDENVELLIYNPENVLVYWSDNRVLPSGIDIMLRNDKRLVKLNNAYHVVKPYTFDNGYNVLSIITVYKSFPLENKYLKDGFVINKSILNKVMISTKEQGNSVKEVPVLSGDNKKPLFYIKEKPGATRGSTLFFVIIEILGYLCIYLVVNRRLRYFLFKGEVAKAAILTVMYAVVVEVVISYLKLPAATRLGAVFSASSYASPLLADSLGALLIRTQLVHWILRHWLRYVLVKFDLKLAEWKPVLIGFLMTGSYYLVIFLISSLHHNSIISFDLYRFDQLELNSYVALLVICFSFGIMYIPVSYLVPGYFSRKFYFTQILAHIFFIFIGFLFGNFTSVFYIGFLILVYIVYLQLVIWYTKNPQTIKKHRFFSSMLLLAVYAFIGSTAILYYTYNRKLDMIQHYAVELASERDYAEEYDLTLLTEELQEDNFIKSYFANPYLSSFDIDRRVIHRYFNKYLGKYNINVHTFNKDGTQLKGEGTKTFYALSVNKQLRGVQRVSPSIYYLSVKPRGEKYMVFMEYYQGDQLLGYLVMEFVPKLFTSYSAYPELLRSDNYTALSDQVQNLSYAIYRNRRLMSVNGEYSYPAKLAHKLPESGKFLVESDKDFIHVIYRMDEKQVVVTYKQLGIISGISFFSYLLIILMVHFFVMSWFFTYGSFWGNRLNIRHPFRLDTLQKQIQTSMISQVLFSLVLVAIMTVFFFTVQYNNLHNERLAQRAHSVIEALGILYAEEFSEKREEVFDLVLKQRIRQLSQIFSIDVNAYNLEGELLYSSQPDMFKRGLLAPMMNPKAYDILKNKGYSSCINDEQIGRLKYLAAYLPFNDPNGRVLGYINFPYYGKEKNIRNDIAFFLMSLVNIYVLLILGAAMMSIWVSKAIVRPLSIITESIRGVELGKKNQPIYWKNKDEIGQLITVYNRMIDELAESASLLAKSEREGAWREMAKQVAHEIKNPLTPMKLSIQHLQRAIAEDRDDIEELTKKIASRLIEQIETLSNIATAFSDFARMPIGKFEHVNITEVLRSVSDLFVSSREVEIHVDIPDEEYIVYADKDQLVRVFNNLIKNAIQAIPEAVHGRLDISLHADGEVCNIIVKDNGVGIPASRAEDIFEPNFTTKTSGTGLGLAMSKSIIEAAGGKIWFESEENKGSSFFVQLNIRKS